MCVSFIFLPQASGKPLSQSNWVDIEQEFNVREMMAKLKGRSLALV